MQNSIVDGVRSVDSNNSAAHAHAKRMWLLAHILHISAFSVPRHYRYSLEYSKHFAMEDASFECVLPVPISMKVQCVLQSNQQLDSDVPAQSPTAASTPAKKPRNGGKLIIIIGTKGVSTSYS